MRILMTTDTIGGVWTFTQELANGLLKENCEIYLISFGRAPSYAQQSWCSNMQEAWGERFRYESSEVPLEWMEDNEYAFKDAAPLLLQCASEFSADILHCNQLCFGALPLKIPRVLTVHSDVLSWADSCRGGILEDTPWLRSYCALAKAGLAGADLIITPTHWMENALAKNYNLARETVVIFNGRSLSFAGAVQRKMQAITAGRIWDEAKNIWMLTDVESPMPLLIAGETQDILKASFPPKDMILLGAQSNERLLDIFCESSIYICTSCYEPFGLAPLEAALCGCVVLAHDIPSLREVWQEGALYFSDASSLTGLLHQLNDVPDQLRAAQRLSINRAAYLTAERMTTQYLQCFQEVFRRAEGTANVS